MLYGFDVSAVQAHVDWPRVAAQGFRFVVVKVSEGLHFQDPCRLQHIEGATKAGLRVGVYHFARPVLDPVAQADLLWHSQGETAQDFQVLDLEKAPSTMTGQDLVDWTRRFRDRCQSNSGRLPVLYSYTSFIRERMGAALAKATDLADCPLWLAQYTHGFHPWRPSAADVPKPPKPWDRLTMWQYTGNGGERIDGICDAYGRPCDVDRNLFLGAEGDLRALCGLPPIEPEAA